MGPTFSVPTSILDAAALAALPSLAVRRAALRERIAVAPARAARGIDAVIRAAASGRSGGWEGTLALASTVAHLRREGAAAIVARLREAAAGEGLSLVAALLEDAPPHRALARLGRPREVCFPERGPLRPARPPPWDVLPWWEIMQNLSPRFLRLLDHPSPVLVARLLHRRYLPLRHVLAIASRRPTSEPVALEIACHDHWFGHTEVREALVQNPFTATPLVLALLPSVGAARWRRLAAGGEAHPSVVAAAGALLALRAAGPVERASDPPAARAPG